jgi:hypothetical protein
MKVFGIGLNKTGTTSLRLACETLGLRHMSCRRDLLVAVREGRLEDVFAVVDAYDSFDDWPWPLIYRPLFERYRDSRFVLTVRASPERWLASLKKHALHTDPVRHCRGLAYGHDYPFGHEREHLAFYERHGEAVQRFFVERRAEDRLLTVCWETGDGWTELCPFLGSPVPDRPFPRANASEDRRPRPLRALRNRLAARYWGPV